MPKFIGGAPPFIGTQDNLTIYFMNGEYIIRTMSSLTGKRVKRDPAFAKTMMYAGWLKQASKIASLVYQQIPADERVYKQYRQLTGKAMSLLKEGFHAADVIIMLEAVYLPQSSENEVSEVIEGLNKVEKVDHNSACETYSSKRTKCKRKSVRASDNISGSKCDDMNDERNYNRNASRNTIRSDNRNDNRNGNRSGNRSDVDKATSVSKVSKVNNVNNVRDEYTQPCYYWEDRPQRVVQVGITGLSYLKYADATDRGLIDLLKLNRQIKVK